MTIATENKIKALAVLAGGVALAFAFIFRGRVPKREMPVIRDRVEIWDRKRERIEIRDRRRDRIDRRRTIRDRRRQRGARQVCRFKRCT